MVSAILENEKSLPRPSTTSQKENEAAKKQAKGKEKAEKERPLCAAVQHAQKPTQNVQEARDPVRAPSAKDTAAAIKCYNSEVLGVLKELSSNQNKINDKLEKLSSRVDSLYEYGQENEYEDEEADRSWNAFVYGDSDQEESTDPPMQEDPCDVECPPKRQKTDASVFKNISDKFNPKEVTDNDIDEEFAEFLNSAFRDGISDDQQTKLIADVHRPSNVPALVKTKVNKSIWCLLKPQIQTDDVKMQTIQNNMIKAAINWSKILNEVGQSISPEMLNLGTMLRPF